MAFMQPVASYFSVDEATEYWLNCWEGCADPCEGHVDDEAPVAGWYGRLSAAGYMDCTAWDGPYATADQALKAVMEMYECDENGDDRTDAEDAV